MLQFKWTIKELRSASAIQSITPLFVSEPGQVVFLDTETTGLHLLGDKPFIIPFGWVCLRTGRGYAFALDLECCPRLIEEYIRTVYHLAELSALCGHNIKFDLHMLANIGYPYTKDNIEDSMFYVRFSGDAIPTRKGGPALGLKNFAARHLDRSAKLHESTITKEQSQMAATYNKNLRERLGMKQAELDVYKKDCTFSKGDLPADKRAIYEAWFTALPTWLQPRISFMVEAEDIPYNRLNRGNVMRYALYDIVYTAETYYSCLPVCTTRQTLNAVRFENRMILPFYDMERIGFDIDEDYLNQAKTALRAYILEQRWKMWELMGIRNTVLQSKRIQERLIELGAPCESTGAEVLDQLLIQLKTDGGNQEAIALIELVQELRTLEKWYATYIIRFQKDIALSKKVLNRPALFTSINQVGAVSGRVSSDFQQFPRGQITKANGEVLFSPRQMVRVPKDTEYDGIVFLDYSQIELRLQAVYTLLVDSPDYNMCRAYMPYDCINAAGERYDVTRSNEQEYVQQEWFLKEAPDTPWHPIDVHGATAKAAFDITEDDERYHELRYIGKRVNFAKNYGCQYGKIKEMFPEFSDEQCHKIDEAYYTAFPGIKAYHNYCNRIARSSPYATNLFGIRYYGVSGHNLKNMLIQGSGAYFLKKKIREVWEYSVTHQVKSRMMMNIHDEIFWLKHKDEQEVFFTYKQIMQDWEGSLVPIIAEMECTKTTWAEKQPCDSLESMRQFYETLQGD